jgi:preprotein translocase subunit YajC
MDNTLFAGLIVAMMVVVLLLLALYLRAQGNRRKDQKARGELNEELRKALRSRGGGEDR